MVNYIFKDISQIEQAKLDLFERDEGFARLTGEIALNALLKDAKDLKLTDSQIRAIILLQRLLWMDRAVSFRGYIKVSVLSHNENGFDSYFVSLSEDEFELRNSGAEDYGAGHDSYGTSYYPSSYNTSDEFEAGEYMLDLCRFHEYFKDKAFETGSEISVEDEIQFTS